MDKVENATLALGDAERVLSDHELELVSGGVEDSERSIIIDFAQVRGLIIDWAASCSNNL